MAQAVALLRPSNNGRMRRCPGSVVMQQRHPEPADAPAAMEGTAAHWVVEAYLRNSVMVELGVQAPNGIGVTREMQEAALMVARTIEQALGPNWHSMLVIERPVQVRRVHREHCAGTPDYYAWARLPDGRLMLFVFDFKFGHGVVEVFENDQLVSYSVGIIEEAGADEMDTVVAMCVIQPRAYHTDGTVRWWKVMSHALRAQVNQLAYAAEEALGPNPRTIPDPVACENCTARAFCEANQRAGYMAADRAQAATSIDMSPLAMGLELKILARARAQIDNRVKGLEAEVEATLRAGKPVPYWSMKPVVGKLKWTCTPAEALAVGAMVGSDIEKKPEPLTPRQAIDAGVPETIVNLYAKRDSGGVKLAPDDGTKARLTFESSVT